MLAGNQLMGGFVAASCQLSSKPGVNVRCALVADTDIQFPPSS